jgi:hypothetical protein
MAEDLAKFEAVNPQSGKLRGAHMIIVNSHRAVLSFLGQFQQSRKGAGGGTTDAQQDLLRAMLLFASAGLDSALKQIVRDCLADIISRDSKAATEFAKFAKRVVFREDAVHPAMLIAALLEDNPRDFLRRRVVAGITAESLQSVEQVNKVGAILNILEGSLWGKRGMKKYRDIFNARNQIAHEMDADIDHPRRNRRQRKQDEMFDWTLAVLELANNFLSEVDGKLPAPRPARRKRAPHASRSAAD